MSGDHGQIEYDEVNTMKQVAIDAGVPSNDIFMDHAGFSTYESIYRAKEIFEADKLIIVSQEYHLYRALYIAKQLGIESEKGSIEVDKDADYLVFENNLLTAEPQGFSFNKPEEVYFSGKKMK